MAGPMFPCNRTDARACWCDADRDGILSDRSGGEEGDQASKKRCFPDKTATQIPLVKADGQGNLIAGLFFSNE